ncbi:Zinc finger and SCAN domain-containing protein [Trichinella pseudospiralis]
MPALKASFSRRSEALAWFTPATDTSVLRCADSTKNAPAVTPAARNSFNRSCRLLPLRMVHIKGEVRRPYLAV